MIWSLFSKQCDTLQYKDIKSILTRIKKLETSEWFNEVIN